MGMFHYKVGAADRRYIEEEESITKYSRERV